MGLVEGHEPRSCSLAMVQPAWGPRPSCTAGCSKAEALGPLLGSEMKLRFQVGDLC